MIKPIDIQYAARFCERGCYNASLYKTCDAENTGLVSECPFQRSKCDECEQTSYEEWVDYLTAHYGGGNETVMP